MVAFSILPLKTIDEKKPMDISSYTPDRSLLSITDFNKQMSKILIIVKIFTCYGILFQ